MSSIESVLANPIVAQFLGLLVGLFTSFFSWWVLFHWLSPRVELSPYIVRQPTLAHSSSPADASGVRYRFKLRNVGRRAIIDLQVRAVVRIRGVLDPKVWSWELVHLPMEPSGDRIYSFPRIEPYRRSKTLTILRLYTHDLRICRDPPFPESVRQAATAGTLTLDDLLDLREVAEVRVFASGYDAFSGARKVFGFTFDKAKVIAGQFVRDSMEAVPDAPPPAASVVEVAPPPPPR